MNTLPVIPAGTAGIQSQGRERNSTDGIHAVWMPLGRLSSTLDHAGMTVVGVIA
ncbi:MAG: hypothetical protein JSS28_10915 [Proteobacteria bacterium]|nr:hypothetical protein [Pseudomonadota bacterium]